MISYKIYLIPSWKSVADELFDLTLSAGRDYLEVFECDFPHPIRLSQLLRSAFHLPHPPLTVIWFVIEFPSFLYSSC